MTRMDRPRLAVRFDIDTVGCMRPGLPWLRDYAREHGVRFTFFANMGRAISHRSVLRRFFPWTRKPVAADKAARLRPIEKLGPRNFAITLALNPKVGASAPGELRALVGDGHELGLHGGRNHGDWQDKALTWPRERLRDEIAWGVEQMVKARLAQPRMFASPGFNSPAVLDEVLHEQHFTLVADAHSPGEPAFPARGTDEAIQHPNTGLAGEPGGVGFFENLYARGFSPRQAGDVMVEWVQRNNDFVCYDHPVFVAGRGRRIFAAALQAWLEAGGEIVPMGTLAREQG